MPRWHIATTPVQIFFLLFRAARVEGKVDDVDISKAYYLMPARPPGAPEDAHGVIFVGNWRVIDVAHGWSEIWTRPGLDRKTRSCITLTALVALGHPGELKMHMRAALRNGLTEDEIKEVLLQSAIYCGVPAANSAFAVAQRVFADLDGRPEAAGANKDDELRSVPLDGPALREAPLPEDITVTVRDPEAFSGAGTYGYVTL